MHLFLVPESLTPRLPMERVEAESGEILDPYTDFEWGTPSGKLSALSWVLGGRMRFP